MYNEIITPNLRVQPSQEDDRSMCATLVVCIFQVVLITRLYFQIRARENDYFEQNT
jgi:hypothetical protein